MEIDINKILNLDFIKDKEVGFLKVVIIASMKFCTLSDSVHHVKYRIECYKNYKIFDSKFSGDFKNYKDALIIFKKAKKSLEENKTL